MPDERLDGENRADERATSGDMATTPMMVCPACSREYAADLRFCPLDGSILRQISTDEDELIGSILDGRYCLLERLGQGGMGVVYLGEHVLTRRRCAIKLIKNNLVADPDAFNRFIREATNAGRINHPHVATVYDFGKSEDGLLYLTLEYVEGEPLSQLLKREGALSPPRAVEIARQITEAVSAAHELGIVHRDLKPGNILLARDRKGGDVVKVLDFGIARATADEQQHLTRTGFIIGTPEYMSPEQLTGDPVDGRADIYSLGCIMYQMVTGHQPFGGSAAHLITRRLTEGPPRPRHANPAIPKALDDVIVTALGSTPQERYQSMDELRDSLLAAAVEPVTTGPRRLAAWLGLRQSKRQREAETPASSTGESYVTTAGGAGVSVAVAEVTREPVDPVDLLSQTATSEERDEFALESTAEIAHSAEGSLTVLLPDADDDSPRRSMLPRIAIGLGVVALLSVMVVVWPSGQTVEPETAEDTTMFVILPPIVPDSVLGELRAELAMAREDDANLRFLTAISRLRSVLSTLESLSTTYPLSLDLELLGDSARVQLSNVETRCEAERQLAYMRNEPAPGCDPS